MLEGLVAFAIFAILIGLVAWVLRWATDYIGIPEPINKVAKVISILAAVRAVLGRGFPLLGVSF